MVQRVPNSDFVGYENLTKTSVKKGVLYEGSLMLCLR